MNEANTDDMQTLSPTNLLSPEDTVNVENIKDLWTLSKIYHDIKGDSVWLALYQLNTNPRPLDNLGYKFDYEGYEFLYFPKKNNSDTIRFSLPKLISVEAKSKDEMTDMINLANSMVAECKFIVMDGEVWLIYERFCTVDENCTPMVNHILNNLKKGAEIFRDLL